MVENGLDIPSGINFSCLQCGECCRRLEVPVTAGERDVLEGIDWGSIEAGLNGVVIVSEETRAAGSSDGRYILARRNGGCVFLSEDNSCLIESHLGRGAKPLACRQFPLTFVEEPGSTIVSASFTCTSILENRGEPLVDREGEIRSLLEGSGMVTTEGLSNGWGEKGSIPSRIVLTADVGLDWYSYQALERRMADLIEDETHIMAIRLLALLRLIDGAITQYGSGDKTAAPFSKWIDQMYSAKGESWLYGLESGWRRGKPSKQRFLAALAVPMMEYIGDGGRFEDGGVFGRRLAIARNRGVIELPSISTRLDVRSMVGVRLDQDLPELRALMVRFLTESLRRKLLLVWPNIRKGLQLILIYLSLAKWYAVALAASNGKGAVGVEELRSGLRAVESLYVVGNRLPRALVLHRLDSFVLSLILDFVIAPEDLAADYSEGYGVR